MSELSELRVVIENRKIRGTVVIPGMQAADVPTADWNPDDLHLEAVTTLEQLLRRGRFGDQQGVELLGKILFRSLFPPGSEVRNKFELLLGEGDFVLRLQIDDAKIERLPWELLYFSGQNAFLVANDSPVLVRFRAPGEPLPNWSAVESDALTVMFAVVQPNEILREIVDWYGVDPHPSRWDVEHTELAKTMEDGKLTTEALRAHATKIVERASEAVAEAVSSDATPGVRLRLVPAGGGAAGEELPDYDAETLQRALARERPQVLHFVGHGRVMGDNVKIALHTPSPGVRWISADELRLLLGGYRPPLVVLHLCQATEAQFETSFLSFATPLLSDGVEAVIAMQYPIHTELAHEFVAGFYSTVCQGRSIERAAQVGRQRVLNKIFLRNLYYRDFAAPVLYVRRQEPLALVKVPEATPDGVTNLQPGSDQPKPSDGPPPGLGSSAGDTSEVAAPKTHFGTTTATKRSDPGP